MDPEARYLARESIELAFVAGLQRLPPRQAAALVLRDVLGFSTAEVADLLDTTETAVKGALQRARAALAHRPRTTAPGSPEERALTRRFADAFAADDIEGLVALLTDDAWLAMPPAPHVYDGPAAIAGFLDASVAWHAGRRFRLVETRANTQPAFACHLDGEPAGLVVLTLDAAGIRGITRFLRVDLERLLPDTL
jgi:RNA polymerase sigma-70 factor (ECF subfamily)